MSAGVVRALVFAVLLVPALAALPSVAFAQQNFFARLGGGFQYGTTADSRSFASRELSSFYYFESGSAEIDLETPFLNYGQGIKGRLDLGYYFGDHFAAGLGFTYHSGMARTANTTYYSETTGWNDELLIEQETLEEKYKARYIGFTPQVTFCLDKSANFSPYLRVGAIIAFPTTVREFESDYYNNIGFEEETTNTQAEFHSRGRAAFGADCGLGFEYKFGGRIGIFAEANLIVLKHKPEEMVIEEYVIDNDPVSGYAIDGAVYRYTENYLEYYDSDFAILQEYMNLSSVGLTIGASFYIF